MSDVDEADGDERDRDDELEGEERPGLQLRRRRRSGLVTLVVVVAAAVAFAVWYLTHPGDLPTSSARVSASGTTDQAVYVGMFTAPDDFGRTLELSGVKVHTTASGEITVTPLLCRDGTLGVTTDPAPFCAQLLNPEGESFGAGDAIVLEIQADSAVTAEIDPVRLGFTEGVQSGTLTAGTGADVEIFGRSDTGAPTAPPTDGPTDQPTEPPTDPSTPPSSRGGNA